MVVLQDIAVQPVTLITVDSDRTQAKLQRKPLPPVRNTTPQKTYFNRVRNCAARRILSLRFVLKLDLFGSTESKRKNLILRCT